MNGSVEIPVNCLFLANDNPRLEREISRCKDMCWRYNQLSPNNREEQQKILKELLGHMGEHVTFMPPFWCDYGYHISVGEHFYANHNLIITDGASVTFGDHVFVAPNCCFTTAEHAVDPEQRKAGMEVAKPIAVGNNVWIGAQATILAGVTIGDNSIIGAGPFPPMWLLWESPAGWCGRSRRRISIAIRYGKKCKKLFATVFAETEGKPAFPWDFSNSLKMAIISD